MRERVVWCLTAALVLLSALAYYFGGWPNVAEGIVGSVLYILMAGPLLVGSLVMVGQLEILLEREKILNWLGEGAGIRRYLLSGAAGALFPGGPYVSYPFVVSFLKMGASMGPVITFVAAKHLWAISIIPYELAFLSPAMVALRFLSTLPFPLLIGLLGQRFYSGIPAEIRKET